MTQKQSCCLTVAVAVDFNVPVVHLAHGLDLKMVAVLPLSSLSLDVVVKVLCDKSLEMVSVLGLRIG